MDEDVLPGSLQLGEDNSNFSFLEPWTGPGLDTAVWDEFDVGVGASTVSISGQKCVIQKRAAVATFIEQRYVESKLPVVINSMPRVLTSSIELDANTDPQLIQGSLYLAKDSIAGGWFQSATDWLRIECKVDSTGETWLISRRLLGVETQLFTSTNLDVVSKNVRIEFSDSTSRIFLDDMLVFEGNLSLGFSPAYVYLTMQSSDASLHEARFGEVRVYDPQFVTTGTLTGSMDLGLIPDDPGVLSWNASMPNGSGLSFRTRTSDTGTGNWSSWSAWMTDSKGSNITSPRGRHLEYQASFSTSLVQYSPVLHDVTANYASGAGLSAESVYNYPNPFSPLEGPTTLRFDLETPAPVEIKIYDLLGRPKWSISLAQGAVLPGVNEIPWKGVDNTGNALPNGAYLMTVEASGIKITKKIAILR